MKKYFRSQLVAIFGVVFFILPSSAFVLLLGLMILRGYDVPKARDWLRTCQKAMAKSAKKLDEITLDRKLRR